MNFRKGGFEACHTSGRYRADGCFHGECHHEHLYKCSCAGTHGETIASLFISENEIE